MIPLLMTTKSIPLQVSDYSHLITSPISIYQFREVPLGPHVHNNSSQLEEYNTFDYLKNIENILVLPVQEQTRSIGELVTGRDSYVANILHANGCVSCKGYKLSSRIL